MAIRFLAALTVYALFAAGTALSGCSKDAGNTTGVLTWNPETDAERQLREQAEKLQSTVGEGSLIGAAVGGTVGLVAGPQAVFQGAKIGQFIGAGAGNYLSSLQANYAEREDVLEQIAGDIAATNEDLEEILTTMRRILAEHETRISSLKAEVAEGRARQQALVEQKNRVARNLDEIGNAIEAAEGRQELFNETRDLVVETPEDAEQLDPYLDILAERIAAMRDIATALASDV